MNTWPRCFCGRYAAPASQTVHHSPVYPMHDGFSDHITSNTHFHPTANAHTGAVCVGRDGVHRRFSHIAYRHPSGRVAVWCYFYDLDAPVWNRGRRCIHRMEPGQWRKLHPARR